MGDELHPPAEAVTLKRPELLVLAFTMEGFWLVELNPFGPVQLYVAPGTVEAVRFKVMPVQSGPLLPAVGAAGGVQTGVALTNAALVLSQPRIAAETT